MSVGKKKCEASLFLLYKGITWRDPPFLVAGQPWPMSSVGTGTPLQNVPFIKWLITDLGPNGTRE